MGEDLPTGTPDSANVVSHKEEEEELNGIAIGCAQQIVDRSEELIAADGGHYGGRMPEGYGIDYAVGGKDLPFVRMSVGVTRDPNAPTDMERAESVGWSVGVHTPKRGERGTYYHTLPDTTISVTASSTNPNLPVVHVGRPWMDSLPERAQVAALNREVEAGQTVLQDFADKSHQAALDIMRQHAESAGYALPEDLTPDAIRAVLENPTGLRYGRQWFDRNVADPVRQRLALGDALQKMDGVTASEDPTAAIRTASAVQQMLIAPDVAPAITAVRGKAAAA